MPDIDNETGLRLLRLARASVTAHISGTALIRDPEPWAPMNHAGVFVTLRKFGALRGCIGTFNPEGPLPDIVCDIAIAATSDPRFMSTPIVASELPDIRIELSVLSPRVRIPDASAFELGVHGIYLRNGFDSGCFLPDVGVDLGWNKERFLGELCRQKAGLHEDAWKDPRTELYAFTVKKLSE